MSLVFLTLMLGALLEASVPETKYEIRSILEVPKAHPQDTIVFFDIDDTLIDSPYMLGSKGWRAYIVENTKHLDQEWHDMFTLFLARKYPILGVESTTSQLVRELQSRGYAVCGLTARERQIWYDTPTEGVDLLTIQQLEAAGIHFDSDALMLLYPDLMCAPEYFQGVFFADLEIKGEYLKKLFGNTPPDFRLPKKIVFIDDKLKQVDSVSSALSELEIEHECYWYRATDAKAERFNPLIANIQLYYFWISEGQEILSDQEAEVRAQQHPERKADYYLQALLTIAKERL